MLFFDTAILGLFLASLWVGLARAAEKPVTGDLRSGMEWTDERIAGLDDHELLKFGKIHALGKGVPINGVLAERLFAATFERNADNAIPIANFYEFWVGDMEKAIHWLEKAVKAGIHSAHLPLGLIFFHGYGVRIDTIRARKHFELTDSEVAARLLGKIHLKGLGVEPDPRTAEKWYVQSVRRGDKIALMRIGRLYLRGAFGYSDHEIKAHAWFMVDAHFDKSAVIGKGGFSYFLSGGDLAKSETMAGGIIREIGPAIARMSEVRSKRRRGIICRMDPLLKPLSTTDLFKFFERSPLECNSRERWWR